MQHGAIFGVVNLLSAEHRGYPRFELSLLRQPEEQGYCLFGNPIFGIIKEQIVKVKGKAGKALRILEEEMAHLHIRHLLTMGCQRQPGG